MDKPKERDQRGHARDFGGAWLILRSLRGMASILLWLAGLLRRGARLPVRLCEKGLANIERKKLFARHEAGPPRSERVRPRPISAGEFHGLLGKYPFYVGRYYRRRWEYIEEVLRIVRRERPQSVLELGPGPLPIVKGSDTMDREALAPGLTYLHDATQFPWPIEDSRYDLFLALQVWEHLGESQQRAFQEVMRIAKAAVLSFPYKWHRPGNVHHDIDETTIAEWTLHVPPEQILGTRKRIIYFFRFGPQARTTHDTEAEEGSVGP